MNIIDYVIQKKSEGKRGDFNPADKPEIKGDR